MRLVFKPKLPRHSGGELGTRDRNGGPGGRGLAAAAGGRAGEQGPRSPRAGGRTCQAGPVGCAGRRGRAPAEESGGAPGGQAPGRGTQTAPGRPHGARQEPGQAPQAFHGAAARRGQKREPSPSCRTPTDRRPGATPRGRPRYGPAHCVCASLSAHAREGAWGALPSRTCDVGGAGPGGWSACTRPRQAVSPDWSLGALVCIVSTVGRLPRPRTCWWHPLVSLGLFLCPLRVS